MIGVFIISWIILFAIARIIYQTAQNKKFWRAGRGIRFIITVSLLSAAGLPGFWLFYYLDLKTFSHEVVTQAVLVHYTKHTKPASVYTYEYKIGDSVFCGYVTANKYLDTGDTIDIIYNKESVTDSYAPCARCYPLLGNIGLNMRFKKYLDKIQTESSHHKFIGSLP